MRKIIAILLTGEDVTKILNTGEIQVYLSRQIIPETIQYAFLCSVDHDKKVMGIASVKEVLKTIVPELWQNEDVKTKSGMDFDTFYHYFNGYKNGCALIFDKLKKFKKPVELNKLAPGYQEPSQNFTFIKEIADLNQAVLANEDKIDEILVSAK